METTFWLSANSDKIYAYMSRGPLACVGTVVFLRMSFTSTKMLLLLTIMLTKKDTPLAADDQQMTVICTRSILNIIQVRNCESQSL